MNPLDFDGPTFLLFFLGVCALTYFIVRLAERRLRTADDAQPAEPLDTHSLAFLSGGANRVLLAVNAGLVHDGHVELSARGRVQSVHDLPDKASPLVRAAHGALSRSVLPFFYSRRKQHIAAKPEIESISQRLQARGLVMDPRAQLWTRLLQGFLFAIVIGLGIAKVDVGLERERPVFLLVLMLAAGLVGIAIHYATLNYVRTTAGDALLERMQSQHRALETAAESNADALSGREASVAASLFGPAVLAGATGTGLAFLSPRLPARDPSAGASSSCGSSSGCGGGGGGCGGGCGGCGG